MTKVIENLHVQFSHLPMSKLVPMLKSVRGEKGTGVLSTVAEKFVCNHCVKFSKAKPDVSNNPAVIKYVQCQNSRKGLDVSC